MYLLVKTPELVRKSLSFSNACNDSAREPGTLANFAASASGNS